MWRPDTRPLEPTSYGVSGSDPVALGAAALLLLSAALLASWLPACPATRVDPMAALRQEQERREHHWPSGGP